MKKIYTLIFALLVFCSTQVSGQSAQLSDLTGQYTSLTTGLPYEISIVEANGTYNMTFCSNLVATDCIDYTISGIDTKGILDAEVLNPASTYMRPDYVFRVEDQGGIWVLVIESNDGLVAENIR